MKITIESTTKIVHLNGVPARIWEGTTENGEHVHVFVTRIAIRQDAPREVMEQFERELLECRPPSKEIAAAYEDRMVIA